MEFATTREPEGAIKTATPGYSGQAPPGDFGAIIGQILARRAQQTQPAQPQQAQQPQGYVPRGGGGPVNHAPSYTPSLGSSPIPKTQARRLVQVRQPANAWAGGSALDSVTYQSLDPDQDVEGTDFRRDQTPTRVDYASSNTPRQSAAQDPRMIALRSQQRAANMGRL